MNKFTKGIAIAVIALGLTACTAIETDISTAVDSVAGQAFLAALGLNGSLNSGVQSVVTAVDDGLGSAATQDALNTVCYALPWADGALDLFGPVAGVNPTIVTTADDAVKAFEAGPCTTPPTTLAAVVTEGVQLFMNIETEIKTLGVPVVVPAASAGLSHKTHY
jgi:hypothetical protein